MAEVTLENVEEVFTYQTPDADQVAAFHAVRRDAVQLARTILTVVPRCADRSVALRKLREARMDANAAIALRGVI